jgi:hypothetical protein
MGSAAASGRNQHPVLFDGPPAYGAEPANVTVTEEMRRAGAQHILDMISIYTAETVAVEVYRAMERARRSKRR